jgi:hypothetical protein
MVKWFSGLPANDIFTCWRTINSSSVAVGTSLDLSADVIHEAPLLFIEDTSSRVMIRYSVLVKQYAITEEAYEFWQNMKKNTETLGSFFDAQPTQLKGNIHCITKPEEPVIGYISGANLQQKRIFIDKKDLPPNFKVLFTGCMVDTTAKGQNLSLVFGTGSNIPLFPLFMDTGWVYTTKDCADCRTKGGTTNKPSFW